MHVNLCNLDERKCYLNSNILEVHNATTVPEFFSRDMFPMLGYAPRIIRYFIERPLFKVNSKNP